MWNSQPELFGHWVHWFFSGLFNAEQQWPLGLCLHLLYRHREVKYWFCIPALSLAVEKNHHHHHNKKKMQSIAPSPGWERVALHLALNNSASFLCLWCLILWCTSVHLFNPALKALNTCAYGVTSALWYTNNRWVKNDLYSSSCLIPIFRSIFFIPESSAAISHDESTRYSVDLWKIAYLAVGLQLPA